MQTIDLRQITSRQLEPVLSEEQKYWLDELHWDYRPSIQLIRKFVDSRSLAGCAVLDGEEVAGYAFYVLEETKGLIGGLYVKSDHDQASSGRQLLMEIVSSLRTVPRISRVEAQLMCFGTSLEDVLVELGFHAYNRLFLLLPLKQTQAGGAPIPPGLRLERWDDRFFEGSARLIQRSYAGHIDSEINDQYRSESGAVKFLKNIVILPGCGEFQPYASFVVKREHARYGDPPVAAILTSTVSMGVGHITQICIEPEFRGRGLGLRLMETAIQALKSRRYHALSLTVTAQNTNAVRLYKRMGFQTLRTFTAAVWQS